MSLHDGGRRDLHADRRIPALLALQMHLHGPLARDGTPLGLTLKLLTFEPTGAIVAAPTMGLPEGIGGRAQLGLPLHLIRDGIHSLYGLLRIGFTEEAKGVHKLAGIALPEVQSRRVAATYVRDRRTPGPGRRDPGSLDGYRGSRPVRLGNGAYDQLQLDIYGELMDAVYLYNKHGSPISYDLWTHLRALINWVWHNWQNEDEGSGRPGAAAGTSCTQAHAGSLSTGV